MIKLSAYDVFRKLPRDLTHGTVHGGFLSVLALLLISLVFVFELWTYVAGEVETSVMLDTNREKLLQINFKISMLRLPCEFTSVDVWDYLGNNQLDLTKNIHKTMVTGPRGERILGAWDDGNPHTAGNSDDEVARPEIGLDESEELKEANFKASLEANHWSFVDFYAPWCIHWYVVPAFLRVAKLCSSTAPSTYFQVRTWVFLRLHARRLNAYINLVTRFAAFAAIALLKFAYMS